MGHKHNDLSYMYKWYPLLLSLNKNNSYGSTLSHGRPNKTTTTKQEQKHKNLPHN